MQKLIIIDGDNRVELIAESFEKVDDGILQDKDTLIPETLISGDGKTWTVEDYLPPPPIIPPPEKENRWITKGAFRNRFTANEKIAIEFASLDNTNDPIQKRQMAAALRVSNTDVMVSTFIDLDRPDTVAGVKKMEDFGIIAAGRSDEILNAEIKDFERFVR